MMDSGSMPLLRRGRGTKGAATVCYKKVVKKCLKVLMEGESLLGGIPLPCNLVHDCASI